MRFKTQCWRRPVEGASRSAGPGKERTIGVTLANYWHPIATSDEITDRPQQFTLLGEQLVAFRDAQGPVVFKDLCIHRGTALSLGYVEEGVLHCGYHGWAYDRSGKCVEIPSLPPGSSIPAKARAEAFSVGEKHGLVWVALDDPVVPIPSFPEGELEDPRFRGFVSHHYVWSTSAGRAVENFMDISHFPFVHEGILGSKDNTVVEPHTVEQREHGLYYMVVNLEPANLHSHPEDLLRWEYFLYTPFTIHLKKTTPEGEITYISMAASPSAATKTNLFLWIVRNHQVEPGSDEEFAGFTHDIMEQDRRIVESQRPEEIPTDLRDELHLRVPDASGLAYRRLLGDIGDVAPFLP